MPRVAITTLDRNTFKIHTTYNQATCTHKKAYTWKEVNNLLRTVFDVSESNIKRAYVRLFSKFEDQVTIEV